jgi:hypothetical protein
MLEKTNQFAYFSYRRQPGATKYRFRNNCLAEIKQM